MPRTDGPAPADTSADDDRHRLSMTILMTPDMSNFAGSVHGGLLLTYLDQVALHLRDPVGADVRRHAWHARRDTGHPQHPAVTPGPASDWSGVPRPESERHGPRVTPGAASGLGR
jgi:hypothetical protein